MARAETLKNNCTSGELTPKLHKHSDLEQYRNGLALCENGIVSPYGGVYRRFGFQFIAEAKYADKICVTRRYEFNESQSYALEIGEEYIRFFTDGGQIINTVASTDLWLIGSTYAEGEYINFGGLVYRSGEDSNIGNQPDISAEWTQTDIVEVTTPYQESELRTLRFEENADVLYIFHPNHNHAKLIRMSQTVWVWGYVDAEGGPFLLENEDQTITVQSSAVTGSGVTITAVGDDLFSADYIGSLWALSSGKMSEEVTGTFVATGVSSDVATGSEKVEIEISGTWDATVIIERSFDKGTNWFPYRNIISNLITTLEDTRDVAYRLNCTVYTSGTVAYRLSVLDESSDGYGSFRITAYTSPTVVTADIVEEIRSTDATTIWSAPAWSLVQGYPRAGKIYEGRLVIASTNENPTGVWGSKVFFFDNFLEGTADNDSFKFTLNAAGGLNALKWMQSWQLLTIGTAGGEIRLTSSQGISPSNPPDKKQDTFYGSADIQAFVAARSVIFIDSSERIVREYIYDDKSKTYDSASISLLSEHIFNDAKGIVDAAYQEKQEQIIWCVLKDGNMAALTYKPSQAVMGWHRHITQGNFESCCTISGQNGHDELWVSVRRKINGSFVRYIETMNEDAENIFGKVPTPILSPLEGYLEPLSVISISTVVEDAKIYFTIDGTTPDEDSTLYTGPFELTSSDTATTVKAIAIAPLYSDSDVTSGKFQNTYGFQLDVSYLDSDNAWDLLG